MAPKSKGHDRVLSALDAFITALDLAKDACGIHPAQIAFASASVLLTMIRVCFFLSRVYGPPPYAYSGLHGQQTRLRRARENLRQCM